MKPFQDQFNSITCNPEDYTCSDPNLTFNDGCNPTDRTADPSCNANGSYNNIGCHPMNPMCWMTNIPTDGSVSLADYALYKVESKRSRSSVPPVRIVFKMSQDDQSYQRNWRSSVTCLDRVALAQCYKKPYIV